MSVGDHAQDVWRGGGSYDRIGKEDSALDILHVLKTLEVLLQSQYHLSHGRFRSWIWFFTQAGIHPDKHAPSYLPLVLPRL